MFWEQQVQHAISSDVGLRRRNNEDAAVVHLCSDSREWSRRGHILIVADGMGGHAVGELASRMASEIVPHTFLKSKEGDARTALRGAVEAANQAIHSRGTQNQDFLHMGTTCTAVALTPRGATIAHVGDSRAYRVRRDRIDQLTFDHSLTWELMKNRSKSAAHLNLHQHRNVITRSLGPEEEVQVDVEGPHPIAPGDVYVLCSDGLSNLVSDEEIGAVVRELAVRPAARLLVHLANARGGPDNITVIVARVGELPANVTPEPVAEPVDDPAGLGWSWLVGFWLGGLLLVIGMAELLGRNSLRGGILTGLATFGLLSLLIGALRARKRLKAEYSTDVHTVFNRVHRTAVGLSSKQLFDRLCEVELELQRSAQEDGWDVAWKDHDAAVQAAESAAAEKRYSRGVRDIARAIDLLMIAGSAGRNPGRQASDVSSPQ